MRQVLSIFLFILSISLYSQEAGYLRGTVTDSRTGEAMIAVNISADRGVGTISDSEGRFMLTLTPGEHKIEFYFVGYKTYSETVLVRSGETARVNVNMQVSIQMLDEVVVSAGRYEQKLSDVTVSMEILKARQISNQNITSLDMILEKTTGINILDGQISIRGGSGFSYGAGSRVLMLVDDMPMLSGDAGDIKWNYLPVENINQVEVIKGASSVLYGSSALNGVINLRNRFPGNEPETEVTLFSGLYMKPKRREMVWWEQPPLFGGATVSHLRKVGNLDIMLSGNYFQDNGYRELTSEKRGRGSLNLRYQFDKKPGLSAGVSSSIMFLEASDFLLWQDADSGAYKQNPATYVPYTGLRYNVDPYVEYLTGNGGKHSLKTRIFTVGNVNEDTTKSSYSRTLFGDYRYQKNFRNGLVWSSGASVTVSKIVANFFDNHYSANYSVYSQVDARVSQRVKLSGGVRWELNTLDGEIYNSLPVLRTGLNYQVANVTFLRGSFGQGYRFPSLAEKFANGDVGALKIFANHDLQPEIGWSAEIGAKQGFSFGNWRGFGDLALFWTQYSEMIEYTFGLHPPDSVDIPSLDHLGFKALNIGNARITGLEFTVTGEGVYESVRIHVISGYTFMHPIDLDKIGEEGLQPDDYILKYRHKHAVKADIEAELKRFLVGVNMAFTSRMINVDNVFTNSDTGNLFLPGYPDYRENNKSAYFLLEARFAWKITGQIRINMILRNLLNKEYIGRPGDIGPPRNVTIQLKVKI